MASIRPGIVSFIAAIRRRWVYALVVIPAGLVIASWSLTAPLTDRGSGRRQQGPAPVAAALILPARVGIANATPVWPEGRLEGIAAKKILLDVLQEAADRLKKVDAYTATFIRQERVNGTLGPEQTIAMKVRHQPFAIYLKFLSPQAGKEVVYAQGHHDNKLIAHSGGLARLLVPRLAVEPDHPIALADSRHAVTEAGLANLTDRLLHFRKLDLADPVAHTVLDRVTDARGRVRLRSIHTHTKHHAERPFAKVDVLYDPETFLPVDIHNYDWPTSGAKEGLRLAEHYAYYNLVLHAALTAIDFDPANPSYAFHRY